MAGQGQQQMSTDLWINTFKRVNFFLDTIIPHFIAGLLFPAMWQKINQITIFFHEDTLDS